MGCNVHDKKNKVIIYDIQKNTYKHILVCFKIMIIFQDKT